jgi:predicted nucleic acid-binding protein
VIDIDTNVLSALMREVPERPVVEWPGRQAAESIWITSITLATEAAAQLAASRQRAGQTIDMRDTQIAGMSSHVERSSPRETSDTSQI